MRNLVSLLVKRKKREEHNMVNSTVSLCQNTTSSSQVLGLTNERGCSKGMGGEREARSVILGG